MTFSIVAHDHHEGSPEWGVAVASKFLAAGAVVPWADATAGAVATQALANVRYGPAALARMAAGASAEEVVAELTSADGERDHRQVGVVDAAGRPATFTGSACLDWAGGRTGDGFCCQGNILTGPEVIDAMVTAYEHAGGDLASRLMAALTAGDEAGGDRRGRQSSALLVVREGGGYLGETDVAIDLRVDDHPAPVDELHRLLGIHQLLFPRPEQLEFLSLEGELAREVARRLTALGHPVDDPNDLAGLQAALFAYVGMENLEERWTDAPSIEKGVLDWMRDQDG